MKFTIEITQHTEIDSMEDQRVHGENVKKICEIFGVKPQTDWDDKEYVSMMVPGKKTINTVVYKQGTDSLDLSKLIMMINKPKGGEEK